MLRPVRRGPFRHRWFTNFTGAVVLGSTGDEVARLAMPLLVLDLTHSLGAAATLRVMQMVPYVLFGAFAGALIDRAEKRTLLIAADAIRVVVTAAVPVSVALGVFSLELLYAAAFLLGTLEVVWGITTDFSVVPALVDRSELTEANAAYLGADRVARIAGPALGGLAIGLVGTANALWVSAASFLPTILVFWLMPPLYESEAPSTPLTVGNVKEEIAEGFRAIFDSAILRSLLVLMFVTNLGNTGLQTLLIYVLSEENKVDPASIGVALSLAGVVQILGSAFAPRIARGRPLGHTMLGVVVAGSVGPLVAALVHDWRLVVAAVAARQTAWAAHIVYVFLPRQREVPPRLRGRVNGSFRTIILVANASSPALLSWIQGAASSSVAFAAAGVLGLAGAAITYFSPLRHYDIREAPEELATVEPVAETEAEADTAAI
jgi:predicted MFS family arabinose efflux permease